MKREIFKICEPGKNWFHPEASPLSPRGPFLDQSQELFFFCNFGLEARNPFYQVGKSMKKEARAEGKLINVGERFNCYTKRQQQDSTIIIFAPAMATSAFAAQLSWKIRRFAVLDNTISCILVALKWVGGPSGGQNRHAIHLTKKWVKKCNLL